MDEARFYVCLVLISAFLTVSPVFAQTQGADGTTCSDSDGGSYTTAGSCTDSGGSHADYCEGNTVRDWYCTGTWNGTAWTTVSCAAGGYDCASGGQACSGGACVAAATTTTIQTTTTTAPTQFNFSLSLSSSSGTVVKGSSVDTTVTVALTSGTAQSVSLSCNNPPSGISCSFNPASCTPPCSSALTISVSSTTEALSFPTYIGVVGTGGINSKQTVYTLNVLSQCTLNATIPSSGCSCGYKNYYSGYCCGFGSGYIYSGTCPSQNASALPPCTVNSLAPSSGCNCGGFNIYSYYCCLSGSAYSQSLQPCPTTTTTTIGTTTTTLQSSTTLPQCTLNSPIPSTGCSCASNYYSGYCCGSAIPGYWSSSPCPTCSSTQPWNCYTENECKGAGGNWCNSYCSSSPCQTYCGNAICEAGETAVSCSADCGAVCPTVYDPVCGSDGRTYGNECQAKAAGISVKYKGSCTTCGNFICEPGESSISCHDDCKQVCVPLAYPVESCDGGWVARYDDKGCVIGYDCQKIVCGNGRCEAGEYPSNCFADCGQYCPKYSEPGCTNGYIVTGGLDSSGCKRPVACCGDNLCSGSENDKNCPDDCGFEKPFCGNGRCDIGEDPFSCPSDCREECPPSVHCPDGSEKPCRKTEFGCNCELCPIDSNRLPSGCRQQTNPATNAVNVICERGTSCPPLQGVQSMESECAKHGGKFMLAKDSGGCEYSDCQFIERPTGPFTTYSKCNTQDEIEAIKSKCASLGIPVQIDVRDECKVATCGRPSEQLCGRLAASARQQIEDKCREQGLRPVKIYDESGCQVLECRAAFECSKELPEEAYKKCQAVGGEMIVKKDENGCVRFADCLRPGDDRDARIDPIERIPEAPELLEIAFKLEELRIKLQMLAEQADNVAKYYESVNSPDAERWKRVADMFEAGVHEVDKIKNDLRGKLDDITIDDLLEVRHSVRYISDVLLKDIAYVMLSTSEEIENIDEENDCGDDGGCFDRTFRRCQPVIFYPEGTRGPRVEVIGLEDNKCVLKASMPAELAPPGFGAVDMTCKIPNYAKGVRNPETDIFPYCEGPMLEMIKQYGTGPGGTSGPPEKGGPPPGLILAFLENGKGPGGCSGKACIQYCDQKFSECMRYIDDWLQKNGGPGGIRSIFEMGEFCENPKNGQECFRWLLERGVDPRDLGPGPDEGRNRRSTEFEEFERRGPRGFEEEFGSQPSGGMKCPDGICDAFERANPDQCPQDCGGVSSGGGFQGGSQPVTTATACPAGSYDCNRVAEDGCESRFPCR